MIKNKATISKVAMGLSLVAVVFSAIVNMTGADILKLAGTQWILISILAAVYAVYLSTCSCGIEK